MVITVASVTKTMAIVRMSITIITVVKRRVISKRRSTVLSTATFVRCICRGLEGALETPDHHVLLIRLPIIMILSLFLIIMIMILFLMMLRRAQKWTRLSKKGFTIASVTVGR